jgi:hypothetical protein
MDTMLDSLNSPWSSSMPSFNLFFIDFQSCTMGILYDLVYKFIWHLANTLLLYNLIKEHRVVVWLPNNMHRTKKLNHMMWTTQKYMPIQFTIL